MKYATVVALASVLLLIATKYAASSPPPTLKEDVEAASPKEQDSTKVETPSETKVAAKVAQAPARVITEKDLKKKITVKPGDILEVRLPYTMPYTWTWSSSLTGLLRPLPNYPKSVAIPREGQTLGGPMLWVGRFEVTGKAETELPLQLIYSRYDHQKMMSQRVASGKILESDAWTKLGAQPLNEGDLFNAAIAVKP